MVYRVTGNRHQKATPSCPLGNLAYVESSPKCSSALASINADYSQRPVGYAHDLGPESQWPVSLGYFGSFMGYCKTFGASYFACAC